MAKVPPFGELIAATTSSAVHLEMRDAYTPDDQRFLDWQAGKLLPEQANPEWSAVVRAHTARGVRFRRARVVSEPLAPFIRFEYEVTAAVSIAAGEQVRWLPRRQGLDLCLPLNDYWLFDGRLVRFHFFSGSGEIVEDEMAEDPAVVKLCAQAFEAVWERAIPHDQYQPV
ncbi:MAG TPA: hypothetical protein VFV73_08310 [Streptosporangiaceae bacterium]|nr:hypothetical protein [Streptosporangiaceae bacterium]